MSLFRRWGWCYYCWWPSDASPCLNCKGDWSTASGHISKSYSTEERSHRSPRKSTGRSVEFSLETSSRGRRLHQSSCGRVRAQEYPIGPGWVYACMHWLVLSSSNPHPALLSNNMFSRLDGLNKEMREWDMAFYGCQFNQLCRDAEMAVIQYPVGKYEILKN